MAVISLSCFVYHKMLRLLSNRGLVGSQGLKRTIKNTPNVDACAEIHFQMNIFDLSASTNPKKLAFLQIQSSNFNSSNYILQLLSSNCNLQILSSKLHSSKSTLNFKLLSFFSKCEKVPTL